MDPKFIPTEHEEKLYSFWEKNGYFRAEIDKKKKPFSIILPPPNANADLHLGHAMFVYEDIMIRFHKLIGDMSFWLFGADHAGIETQFVFEKHLKKQDKSRFDYDRETLYKMIWDFVMENKIKMENQLRRLGFALDWSQKKFTMDEDIVKIVYKTFQKLHDKDLVYRASRLVNYCTYCGTSYSDLEVVTEERIDPLYYMKYGPFTLATVRPETKFGDTAVAVHPTDKRYKEWIGKEIEVQGLIGTFKVVVVADDAVDPKFGTGALKITPAHDFNDYEIAQRHNLPMKQVIGFDGKLNELTGKYQGLRVNAARALVVADLKEKGLLVKVKENYKHRVATCYRCKRVLEPLPKEQWFVKVKPLADKAKKLISSGKINVYPKRFGKQLVRILDNFIDWNISRQIVWGIRIPAFYNKLEKKWIIETNLDEQKKLLKDPNIEQDSDTFDTWFSSAQWPFATLQSIGPDAFDYFYPTSVMETGYDLLRAWISRMVMIGEFATGREPFQTIFLHGMVRDKMGQKMSKSKGNVINPLELVDTYGADALRGALLFGTKEGGDVNISEDRVRAMRNFANKMWNMGRFIYMNRNSIRQPADETGSLKKIDESQMIQDLDKEYSALRKKVLKQMDAYHFSGAFNDLYEFVWHRFADYYIEQLKVSIQSGNIKTLDRLEKTYCGCMQLLHPFMPFVTEATWKVFNGEKNSILDSRY